MIDLSLPPRQPLVAASILSADFGYMVRDCQDVLARGADLLHIDVMDGHFVPNLTMGADMCRWLRKHFPDTYLDVHLMVERPEQFVDMFADAGADMFSFHLEVCQPSRPADQGGIDGHALIDRIRQLGMGAGMVINPPTPPDGLEAFISQLDMVLVMSVNPGRSGQKFMPEVLEKTRWVHQRLEPHQRLQMDGGLSPLTAPQATAAGADVLVTASALFGSADRSATIAQLHASPLLRVG